MATVKYSRQREAIKNCLMGRTDHPTADTIYQTIRETFPNISLGTVYRNLTFLAENSEILRISCGEHSERFDGNTSPHHHCICSRCGRVDDIFGLNDQIIDELAGIRYSGRILGHQTYFYGLCAECAEYEENENSC